MTESNFFSLSEKIWAASGRREDLVARVANALREQILSGQLAPGAKLVAEAELAKHLSISRPSLREAIRILGREGLILVKHGVGTFVSTNTKPMLGSLELMRSITDLVRDAGGEPICRDLSISLIKVSVRITEELELADDTQVGLIVRVRLIDDTPFIVAKEYVVLDDGQRNFDRLTKFKGGSLYAFLRQDFGVTLSHSKARISAVAADGHTAKMLKLRQGAPLLLMHEIHYGFDGKPVLLSINYHNTGVVEFTSIRSGAPV